MQITRVEPIPINVPLKQGMTTKTAHGEHIESPYVIIKIYTDEGLVGLGEATLSPRWSGETSASCVFAVNELIAPLLIGSDPTSLNVLTHQINKSMTLNPFTKAAVEMALWDLAGKVIGVPVYQLLGGKVRDDIPMKMVVGAFETDRAVALAERFLGEGVNCLKVKVGLDPDEDIKRVEAIRNLAGPSIKIGIDANGGWPPAVARRMLRAMEAYDLIFAEQPIGPQYKEDMAYLRSVTTIPIMADESVFTVTDAREICENQRADILSVYPGKHGGIGETIAINHLASATGLACHMGSNLELGIATAAMLHVASALRNIASERYPGDLLGPLYHEADMLTQSLDLGPTSARVPDGPGLGVEIDESQITRWREE